MIIGLASTLATDDSAAIDLWLLDPAALASSAVHNVACALLSAAELERFARFQHVESGRHFLGGRLLARTVLGARLGVAPRDIAFALGPHGKPALALETRPRLHFNLSHTRGLVALAITTAGEVGLDVEDCRARRLDIADRFFAPPEIAALRATPEGEQAAAFHALWTLKESFVKARGTGLSLALDTFAVGLHPPRLLPFGVAATEADQWHFTCLSPTSSHRAAICVHASPARPLPIVSRWFALPGQN
ncbi:MAG: 4'-phosphopantetheinyl transferase superfamily protein [Acidobacteriota bacterium]